MHPVPAEPPDYLLLGHVTKDLTPDGDRLGGTVAYAGLTAAAYGVRTALVTSCAADCDLSALACISIHRVPAERTTVFENRYRGGSREQKVHAVAKSLEPSHLPEEWRTPAVVHFAPVVGEIHPSLLEQFPHALRCATLQGWMRTWGSDGIVRQKVEASVIAAAEASAAVVFSLDDVEGDETEAQRLAERSPVAAVTEGAQGCRVYWNGHVRRFSAPRARAVDPTGAGDIFAAVFFLRLQETGDAFEAARMANAIAAHSIERQGLAGAPGRGEILQGKMVIEQP
jgi:sugar/nucleoside kinase (ribokinase family)